MTYKTRAIIIKRINVFEADKIITFYTANLGKIRARAQGVRKIEAKLGGHLELFMLADLMIAKGRNLDVVASAQAVNSFSNIRTDLIKTSFAYFIGELIEKLVPDELKDTRIFNLLVDVFETLNDLKIDSKQYPFLLLSFEIKLLDLLGFAPQVSHCVHCAKNEPSKFYFSALLGGILCENCRSFDRLAPSITDEEIKCVMLIRSYKHYTNLTLENLQIKYDIIVTLSKKIDYFIRFIFEKNIKSTQLIQQVKTLINL